MTRDFALILLAGACAVISGALIAVNAEPEAVAPIVGIGSFALGRLGGPPPVKD